MTQINSIDERQRTSSVRTVPDFDTFPILMKYYYVFLAEYKGQLPLFNPKIVYKLIIKWKVFFFVQVRGKGSQSWQLFWRPMKIWHMKRNSCYKTGLVLINSREGKCDVWVVPLQNKERCSHYGMYHPALRKLDFREKGLFTNTPLLKMEVFFQNIDEWCQIM